MGFNSGFKGLNYDISEKETVAYFSLALFLFQNTKFINLIEFFALFFSKKTQIS